VGKRKNKGFPVYWDEIKMTGLAKRYGVELVEDEEGHFRPPKAPVDEGKTAEQRTSQAFKQERMAWNQAGEDQEGGDEGEH